MLYVLTVVFASYRLGWRPALFCALAAVVLLNYLFTPPRFTFRVEAQENLVALATLLAVAIVISRLVAAVRREAESARVSERRARELQELAVELAGAQSSDEVRTSGLAALKRAFQAPVSIGLREASGALDFAEEQAGHRRDGMLCCIREAATLGPGTGRWPQMDAWYIPLGDKGQCVGAACIEDVSSQDLAGREHAEALCTLIGQALWRLQLTASMHAAHQASQWHLLQNTFLAAISHDLRTPLAAIMGAASSLQMQSDKLGPSEREQLVSSILNESEYLSTVAENTLQLVRLDNSGGLNLDWVAMEEVVGAVLARVRQRDTTRRIKSSVPAALPLIRADAVLIAQLLENLLDNALKYSTDSIDLAVGQFDGQMRLTVEDRGGGVADGQEQAIFEPYRRSDRSGKRGAGLGLAVCKAIAAAHGGALSVARRDGGGSSFVAALPIERHQPEAT